MNEEDEDEVEEIKHALQETMGQEEMVRREAAARKTSVVSHQEYGRTMSTEEEEMEHLKEQIAEQKRLMHSASKVSRTSAADAEKTTLTQLSVEESVPNGDTHTHKEEEQEEAQDEEKKEGEQAGGATLIEKEVAETGSVGWDVYSYYMRALGVAGVVACVSMQIFYQVTSIGTNVWLEVWTDNELVRTLTSQYWSMLFSLGQLIRNVLP